MAQHYVLWISNRTPRGKPSLCWSLPFIAIADARRWCKAHVDDGKATLASVWSFEPGQPGKLDHVYPAFAYRIVRHYLDMAALAAKGAPPTRRD